MEQLKPILEGMLAAMMPAILALLYAFAAKHVVDAAASLFDKLGAKIVDLNKRINQNETMARLQIDDFILGRLREVVLGVKDSLVDSLKDASADGKLTKEEAAAAVEAAKDAFKKSLSKDELTMLLRVLGSDFLTIIGARIPGVVALLKVEDAVSPEDSLYDPTLTTLDDEPES